jgi:hypothetical protein
MFLLRLPARVSTGKCGLLCRGALRFKKGKQTRRESSEAESGLARYQLVVIAAQQILRIFNVDPHFPVNGQDIHQGLHR